MPLNKYAATVRKGLVARLGDKGAHYFDNYSSCDLIGCYFAGWTTDQVIECDVHDACMPSVASR